MPSTNICIIGTGASGIATAKVFKDHKIAFDCYEKGSNIGGNWRYENDNGMSAAYQSLHINTSKDLMNFSDFPMPENFPDYPHHSQILSYFESYVSHFGLREHMIFNTAVTNVVRESDGAYTIHTDTGLKKKYSHVVVANGHHWDPRYPEPPFPGVFSGKTIHAHDYRTADEFAGKRVLVVGIGNSGVDIACELARRGGKTFISTRSGAHIMPKYILGKPTDTLSKPPLTSLPLFIQRIILSLTLWIARGKQEDYGVPKPKRKLLQEHPTVSADILNMTGHGKITFKPNIQSLENDNVVFEDGSEEMIDVIIYATGYKVSFPFFDSAFISAKDNQLGLYHFVVHPDHEHLYFIGLIQPLGAVMPLAELQAKWVAKLITGQVKLPSVSEMHKKIKRSLAKMSKRYIDRPRHTLQVDVYPYTATLNREMKKMRV